MRKEIFEAIYNLRMILKKSSVLIYGKLAAGGFRNRSKGSFYAWVVCLMGYKSSQIEESEKRLRISGNSRKVEGKIKVRKIYLKSDNYLPSSWLFVFGL